MRLYIAGPCTGLPDLNFPAFDAAAVELEAAGFEVINPTRHGQGDPDKTWLDYLLLCLRDVDAAEGVALLDGWENSKGARVEQRLAEVQGKPTCRISLWLRSKPRPSRRQLFGDQIGSW